MTLREEILDSLADCPRTISLIEQYFKVCKVSFPRNEIFTTIYELLDDESIYIWSPKNSTPHDFKNTEKDNTDAIDEFWFDLSEKGRTEQQAIDYDPPEEDM